MNNIQHTQNTLMRKRKNIDSEKTVMRGISVATRFELVTELRGPIDKPKKSNAGRKKRFRSHIVPETVEIRCTECGFYEFDEMTCTGCGIVQEEVLCDENKEHFTKQDKELLYDKRVYFAQWLVSIQCLEPVFLPWESFLSDLETTLRYKLGVKRINEIDVNDTRNALRLMGQNKMYPHVLKLTNSVACKTPVYFTKEESECLLEFHRNFTNTWKMLFSCSDHRAYIFPYRTQMFFISRYLGYSKIFDECKLVLDKRKLNQCTREWNMCCQFLLLDWKKNLVLCVGTNRLKSVKIIQ